jgi:uncharacterized protein (DUF4415 family)
MTDKKPSRFPELRRAISCEVLSPEEEARIQAGIALDPDNPELTDEELASLRPTREVLPPALYAALTNKGGRPKSAAPKVQVSLRLDPDVLEAFKATGTGWQRRINDALRKVKPKAPSEASQRNRA